MPRPATKTEATRMIPIHSSFNIFVGVFPQSESVFAVFIPVIFKA